MLLTTLQVMFTRVFSRESLLQWARETGACRRSGAASSSLMVPASWWGLRSQGATSYSDPERGAGLGRHHRGVGLPAGAPNGQVGAGQQPGVVLAQTVVEGHRWRGHRLPQVVKVIGEDLPTLRTMAA